jgi:hypothetical protein
MGGACSTDGTREMHKVFRLESLTGRNYSEDLGLDVKIILEWILGKYMV